MIGRRALLGSMLGVGLAGVAKARGEDDAPAPEEPDVFGERPLRANEDAVRASGSFGGFLGSWLIEVRARGTTGPALRGATWKRGRLFDRSVSISLREYRRLRGQALALARQELARDANARIEEQRLHEREPDAPTTVPAMCFDGPSVSVEIGAVEGAVVAIDGKGCYDPDDDSAGGQIGHLLEAAARRHGAWED